MKVLEQKIGLINKVETTVNELVKEGYKIIYANYEDDLTVIYRHADNMIQIDNKNIITLIHFDIVKDFKQNELVDMLMCDIFI